MTSDLDEQEAVESAKRLMRLSVSPHATAEKRQEFFDVQMCAKFVIQFCSKLLTAENLQHEIASLRNQVSKKQRKCNALRDAVDHLAEKLAAVRSSLKNKKSQIARLIREKTRLIREKNGEMPIDDPQPSD